MSPSESSSNGDCEDVKGRSTRRNLGDNIGCGDPAAFGLAAVMCSEIVVFVTMCQWAYFMQNSEFSDPPPLGYGRGNHCPWPRGLVALTGGLARCTVSPPLLVSFSPRAASPHPSVSSTLKAIEIRISSPVCGGTQCRSRPGHSAIVPACPSCRLVQCPVYGAFGGKVWPLALSFLFMTTLCMMSLLDEPGLRKCTPAASTPAAESYRRNPDAT